MKQQTLQEFLDHLASQSPTPGGGGAAALSGAMGAALVSMVCNLTIGKKKYAQVEADMQAILAQSEALRARLTDLIDDDAQAFEQVMATYQLPRKTDEEKKARREAIQAATKESCLVPLAIAQACADVISLSKPAAEMGNVNVISDAGVGALSALAGLKSAALNVFINLNSLKDEAFIQEKKAQVNDIIAGQEEFVAEISALLEGNS